MKLRVSADLCCGAQRCAMVAPEVYSLVDGFSALVGKPDHQVPPELEDIARRGARACPECAIQVIED